MLARQHRFHALASRLMGGLLTALLALILSAGLARGEPFTPPTAEDANTEGLLSGRLLNNEEEQGHSSRWQLLRPDIITYTIQPGDNDWSIAQRFDLDIDTLRFANEWMRRNPDLIHPGKEVIILPVMGAYCTVQAGDTLETIARRYGVSPSDIADFPLNQVENGTITTGQQLVIPGGRLDYAERILPPGPGSGYPLAWPMRGTISQGYRAGHRALDIASYYGAKAYASHEGVVTYARFSSGGWLGFTVTIAHGGGLVTRYSHLSGIFIEEGQSVARGQLIGQVGSTGNSTGPHVHFEVFHNDAKVNPLDFLPGSPSS